MLEFYYSEDKGLLDRKAHEFRLKHPSCKTLKAPSLYDLQMALFQKSVLESTNFFIIEEYQGPTEELELLLSNINIDEYDLIFLNTQQKNIKLPKGFEEIKINKLDEKTKKSYLNALIKEKKLKLSKDIINQIKKTVSPNASIINDLISNLSLLNPKDIDAEKLQILLDDPRKEINYFSFFSEYIKGSEYLWLEFMNKNIDNTTSYQQFFHAFVHKLYEFKCFLNLRHKDSDLKKIASVLKTKSFFLNDYEKFWKQYEYKIIQWIDHLITELFFLQRHLNKSFQINIELIKHLLLKERVKLETWKT